MPGGGEGSTTREVLAPSLEPGQVVVMDNLSSHKGGRVSELIEERGCELVYLPPYSPDFNPIEEAFAKVKALLRGFSRRALAKLWWKRWARRSMRSRPGQLVASSSIAATV